MQPPFVGSGFARLEREEDKIAPLRFAIFSNHLRSSFCAAVYSKRFIPILPCFLARQNRKMLANPTRQHFSATFKRHKNKSGTKTPAPHPSKVLRSSAL